MLFLKNHGKDVWACDILPVGELLFRQAHLFFIVEPSYRRIVHFNVETHPTDEWVAQQLRQATPSVRDHAS
jgi:putative transposase